jgi:predicted RNA binding protein YcfA (HicA-like mRNA interferase family)
LSGRELDAMVAQHVFRLRIEQRTNGRTGEKDFLCEVHPGQWNRCAFYSASLAASVQVEMRLRELGWQRKDSRMTGSHRVALEHADGRTVEATSPINEALARAALKAVGPHSTV